MSKIFKYKLGATVRCKYSGFEGVIVARVQFINKCVQYNVLPFNKDKSKIPEDMAIDEQSLEKIRIVKKKKIKVKKKPKRKPKRKSTGGPMHKIMRAKY